MVAPISAVIAVPAQAPEREPTSEEGEQEPWCDLNGVLSFTSYLLVGGGVSEGLPFANEDKFEFGTIELALSEFERRSIQSPSYNREIADVLEESNSILISPTGIVDQAALRAAQESKHTMIFVGVREAGRSQVRPFAVALATSVDGETWHLSGECGQKWQAAIDSAAAEMGRAVDIDFMAELTDNESTATAAMVNAYWSPPSADAIWLASRPSDRSLHLGDIPASQLAAFDLAGLEIVIKEEVPEGFIALRTDQGVLAVVATSNVSGVIPIMVPKRFERAWLTFETEPILSAESVVVGEALPSDLNPITGSSLTVDVDAGDGRLLGRVAPLDVGALERILNLNADEIRTLREWLLAEAYGSRGGVAS